MPPPKKPQSSYLLFCNERRKQVTEAHPGLRIGEIQKILSTQWKELTPEEKEHYTTLAAKDKERYEKELLENPVQVPEQTGEEDAAANARETNACIYPLGRVKKIIQSDPDSGKISREALIAISKASELFAQFLGTKSYEHALYRNKRQVKMSDVTRTIQTTGSLDWLREDFPETKPAASARSAPVAKPKQGDADSAPRPDATAFFQRQSRPAVASDPNSDVES